MKIIYTNENGGVNVVSAASKKDIEFTLKSMPLDLLEKEVLDNRLPQSIVDNLKSDLAFELSDEDWKAIVVMQSIPAYAKDYVVLPDDYVLPSREFRDAWAKSDDNITHNFSKAKEIQLSRLRFDRDSLLSKYDGLQSRAVDLQDVAEQTKIKAIKQELRDATSKLVALTDASIDDIKNATPDLSIY